MRRNFCQACSFARDGVKTRIAIPHTCGWSGPVARKATPPYIPKREELGKYIARLKELMEEGVNYGMNKLSEIQPVYCEEIPEEMEAGKLYICIRYNIAVHLCACGCGVKTPTPIKPGEWTLTDSGGKITLRPSIGNFMGESPYHAHYYITDNKIQWC